MIRKVLDPVPKMQSLTEKNELKVETAVLQRVKRKQT